VTPSLNQLNSENYSQSCESCFVKMKKNHQVGEVLEIRGKRAVVKIGLLPMQVE